jgi:hypothetical protein
MTACRSPVELCDLRLSSQAAGQTCRSAMVAFLIHVMGEETPRAIVCDSAESARREAALLGVARRCYTIVEVDGSTGDVPLRAD